MSERYQIYNKVVDAVMASETLSISVDEDGDILFYISYGGFVEIVLLRIRLKPVV